MYAGPDRHDDVGTAGVPKQTAPPMNSARNNDRKGGAQTNRNGAHGRSPIRWSRDHPRRPHTGMHLAHKLPGAHTRLVCAAQSLYRSHDRHYPDRTKGRNQITAAVLSRLPFRLIPTPAEESDMFAENWCAQRAGSQDPPVSTQLPLCCREYFTARRHKNEKSTTHAKVTILYRITCVKHVIPCFFTRPGHVNSLLSTAAVWAAMSIR